ncbi:lysosomal acid glucosylceramidase-like [Nomia melanderi]|uniref:lysosomal acid glucosylceramidase-like n=1 Tax=Nomia melanderi TaxID=2448451 RepID=UPI003FCE0F52
MWKTLLLTAILFAEGNTEPCVPYTVDNTLVACVCNATYCDYTLNDQSLTLQENEYYWYQTNKAGLRLEQSEGTFKAKSKKSSSKVNLVLDRKKKYQTILGFGGAFTDSTGMNINKLSRATQDQLMRTYYDPKVGSNYNMGRFPIAGTDFSIRPYSYDDVTDDKALRFWSLQPEDHKYKIPYARQAQKLNPTTKFYAAAWSAPGWMKTSGEYAKFGFLKKEYYQTFANYLTKFALAYQKHGLDIWAITTGNEPTISTQIKSPYVISMGWTPETMAEWVANNLGPTLAASKSNQTVILALDDDRYLLPNFVKPILGQKSSSKYTIGTAVHWYFPYEAPITVLDETHDLFPNKIILMTEASQGPTYWGRPTMASDMWDLGARYMLSIMQYLNNWSVGWVDWNLVLDREGGPTWMDNTLNAPIVVNPEKDEFYKLPMYYGIAHVSKFVDRGSVRVSIDDTDTIKTSAFMTPSKEVVITLYNTESTPNSVTITDAEKGSIELNLSPLSMNTVVYKQ